MANDPILKNTYAYYDMTRDQMMVAGYKKLNRMHSIKLKVPLDYKTAISYINVISEGVSKTISFLLYF